MVGLFRPRLCGWGHRPREQPAVPCGSMRNCRCGAAAGRAGKPPCCARRSRRCRARRPGPGGGSGAMGLAPWCGNPGAGGRWGVVAQSPRSRLSAWSTARSSPGSSRPADRPRRCGSTTVVCSTSTRVSVPSITLHRDRGGGMSGSARPVCGGKEERAAEPGTLSRSRGRGALEPDRHASRGWGNAEQAARLGATT